MARAKHSVSVALEGMYVMMIPLIRCSFIHGVYQIGEV
jgi:hypothetical protein